jgi:hypothetical protein
MDTGSIRLALFGVQLTLFGILVVLVRSDQAAYAFLFGIAGLALSAVATLRR